MTIASTFGNRILVCILAMLIGASAQASNPSCELLFAANEMDWSSQLNPAHQLFSDNITKHPSSLDSIRKAINTSYNDPLNPHARVLSKYLKVQFGLKGSVPSIPSMMRAYEQHMDQLVKDNVISRKDVLLPAFVFRTLHGDFIWRTVDQPIPDGARIYGEVLSNSTYYKMLLNGYFPVGSEVLTPTRVSSFEHDLSHITSFIEHPQYMAKLRRLAEERRTREYYGNLDRREYFLGESLTLIKPETKEELFDKLVLTRDMRENLDEITYLEMVAYLNKFPTDDLLDDLQILKSNFHKYFNYYGGASRDGVAGPVDRFHSMYRVMLSEAMSDLKYENSVESLASLQIILIRLRNTSLEDWFGALDHPTPDPKSPIGKFFKGKDVWDIEDGDMRAIFTEPYFKSNR